MTTRSVAQSLSYRRPMRLCVAATATVLILCMTLLDRPRSVSSDDASRPDSMAATTDGFIPATLMSKRQETTLSHNSFTLDTLVEECQRQPWWERGDWKNAGQSRATIIPTVTCMQRGQFRVLVDNETLSRRGRPSTWSELRQDSALISPEALSNSWLNAFQTHQEYTPGVSNYSDATTVIFHRTLAITISSLWNSVNFYHMLMDGVISATHWMETVGANTTLSVLGSDRSKIHIPASVVHVGDERFLYVDQKKTLCKSCMAFSAGLTISGGGDAVIADGTDKRAHCFCGAAIFGMNRLDKYSNARRLGTLSFKTRLAHVFNELPYGQVATTAQYTRLGYWKEGSDPSVPRMLFVNRKKRRIGNADRLVALAKEIGFNVAVVYFESLTPAEQYHLSRYADVLVGIHGMALTYVANMDGTGSFARCRTLIELMHWVHPTKFYIYHEMALLSEVAFLRAKPIDVTFGPSVSQPAYEKRQLMKPNFYWWSLKGFDDQTVVFDVEEVRRLMSGAYKSARECTR